MHNPHPRPRSLPRCRTGLPTRPQHRDDKLRQADTLHRGDGLRRNEGLYRDEGTGVDDRLHGRRTLDDHSQPSLQRAVEVGWDKPLVRLAFASCQAVEVHSPLSAADAQAAVVRAVATWNALRLPVQIEVVEDSPPATDILVAWTFANSDPDGNLNWHTQAHADFPPGNNLLGPPLPLHFNADFRWGNARAGCFDVETVALHELGHCLGLVYHSSLNTIMYDAIREAPFFVRHQLDLETIARARQLYQ